MSLFDRFRFLKKEAPPAASADQPNYIDIGHGFEVRQLINEKWILCKKNYPHLAYDLVSYGYKWPPGSCFYKDCMANSSDKILKIAKEILAAQGVFKD